MDIYKDRATDLTIATEERLRRINLGIDIYRCNRQVPASRVVIWESANMTTLPGNATYDLNGFFKSLP